MNARFLSYVGFFVAVAGGSLSSSPSRAFGQEAFESGGKPLVVAARGIGRYAQALGMRVEAPGKERLTISGTLVEDRGASQVSLTYELSGAFRLDYQGGRTLGFDGDESWSRGRVLGANDRDLMEALSANSPEGFFSAIRSGSGMRRLGERFRADDGTTPNYAGPYFDVYQLGGPVPHQGDDELRTRFFYFDSETGLLRRVRYLTRRQGASKTIEVRFDDWLSASGDAIPQHITVFYDDSKEFEFTATGATFSTRADDGAFRQ